jgi:hypothetical protein
MTEQEWLTCTNPEPMLKFLKGRASPRKLRLFACACVRRISHMLTDVSARQAVEIAENYADGLLAYAELKRAWNDTSKTLREAKGMTWRVRRPQEAALRVIHPNASSFLGAASDVAWTCGYSDLEAHRGELAVQASLLRDLFNHPTHPVSIAASYLAWNDETIPKIAWTIYQKRRFEDMPILADALEEAGCSNAQLLSHLRGPGPHVRGCWALDLILGKS